MIFSCISRYCAEVENSTKEEPGDEKKVRIEWKQRARQLTVAKEGICFEQKESLEELNIQEKGFDRLLIFCKAP